MFQQQTAEKVYRVGLLEFYHDIFENIFTDIQKNSLKGDEMWLLYAVCTFQAIW